MNLSEQDEIREHRKAGGLYWAGRSGTMEGALSSILSVANATLDNPTANQDISMRLIASIATSALNKIEEIKHENT